MSLNRALIVSLNIITDFPAHLPAQFWKQIRLSILLSLDIFIVALSYYMAFVLRFDHFNLGSYWSTFWFTLPIFLLIHTVVYFWLGMYRQLWRYANFNNAILISSCTLFATSLSVLVIYLIGFPTQVPRSVPIIYWSLATMLTAVVKYSWRGLNTMKVELSKYETECCFVYGAGKSGELLARYIKENSNFPYSIAGFIDDDPNKIGRNLYGKRILGTGVDLEVLARKHKVTSVIIAMNLAPGRIIREVVARCYKYGLKPLIMPEIADSMSVDVVRPRKVDVKDILRRSPKSIDSHSVGKFFKDKVVLVTGAGGTIGSEVARQVWETVPSQLLLLDNSEFNLYSLELEFSKLKPQGTEVVYLMGSVTDQSFIDKIFTRYNVDIVVHAAAFKHVHLVEANPIAGTINNVQGTRLLADAAAKYGTRYFLLVSSDKAVRPVGVMGMTKRACELYLQVMHETYGERCKFCSVRFGNVLGSSGSVIPRFLEQIESGGPVTVTHPDMTRYFMLVSEAVSLVLQSMVLTKGGEIFVLKMGDPVNIFEMAKQLIELSGKRCMEEVDIVFTGLRPGEKLYEELLYDGTESKTEHEDILIVHPSPLRITRTMVQFDELIRSAQQGDEEMCRLLLSRLISETEDKQLIWRSMPAQPAVSLAMAHH